MWRPACSAFFGAGANNARSARGSGKTRENALVGEIWQPASGSKVDARSLFAALTRADFVLLGEQHDNPDHHRLQAEAVAALYPR